MTERIIVASGNVHKIEEISSICSEFAIPVVPMKKVLGYNAEIEENGATFVENATIKAKWLAERFPDDMILADDSGLAVDALNGAPGVFSARYAGEPCDDSANIAKLLSELEAVPENKRTARFVCAMVLIYKSKEYGVEGECHGRIINEMKGKSGFGYDPVFVPTGNSRTFGELSSEVKNRISHRSDALRKMKEVLNALIRG